MKYGFLGCGNMGGAIATALCQATNEIYICDRSGKAKSLAEKLGITYCDIQTVVNKCDALFLAVKPQNMAEALLPIKDVLATKKPLIISMAAGIELETLQKLLGAPLPIIRIMPNTPVAVGAGMTLYSVNEYVSATQIEKFLADMSYTGKMDEIPEALIDAAGVVSGCGPAYVYLFAEALADGAVACGVPRKKALDYAATTLMGAGKMMLETQQHPGTLKDAVCSPGGSTIAGLNVLEERAFRGAIIDCVKAAFRRNQELGK